MRKQVTNFLARIGDKDKKCCGDTKGGISRDRKVLTVPLYLADRISFSLGKRCD